MKSILTLFIIITSVFAETKTYNYSTYKEASSALNSIKFNMESTKAGLITTKFSGISKSFSISYNRYSNVFKNMKVTLIVKELDTDIDARNEKMHESCFDYENSPKIKVSIVEDVLIGIDKEVNAIINLRGKDFPIKLKLTLTDQQNTIHISGSSKVSLKALEIPDPSIWIASVRDRVDISFNFTL